MDVLGRMGKEQIVEASRNNKVFLTLAAISESSFLSLHVHKLTKIRDLV